jgi:hypothetical protein
MSELTYRSFFTPATSREVGPYGADVVSSTASLSTFNLEWYYEAIVRDRSKGRNKVTARDIEFTGRELLVEIDRRLLQRLKMWKSFQHYKRWYDRPSSERGISDVSLPIVNIDHGVGMAAQCPVRSYREVPVLGLFDATSHPNSGLSEWYDPVGEDGIYVLEPQNLDELIAASFARLVPKVRTKVQLLNSLWELKDFVTLKHTINRIRTLGHGLRKKSLVGSFRDVAGVAADLFLQLEFNIKPLIRDIQGIHAALVDSLGRMRRLMSFDGVPQVTKYKRDLRVSEGYSVLQEGAYIAWLCQPSYDVVFHPGGTNSGWDLAIATQGSSTYRTVNLHQELFCAQLRFIARWSQAQHRYAEQLGLIDALGLSFNPKHLWDAIPWSFVVDWVIKVGDFLDQFATGALDPVLDVLDYSWSIKRQRSIDLVTRLKRYDPADTTRLIEDKLVVYPTFREEAYRRSPIDVGRIAPILSGLSSHELGLAAALLISRKRKLSKPKKVGEGLKRLLRKLKRAK